MWEDGRISGRVGGWEDGSMGWEGERMGRWEGDRMGEWEDRMM